MKLKLTLCALLLLALFLSGGVTALASGTWYVNGVNGNDNNDCKSPQTACKTIGHAISLASSGDTVSVAAATYTENVTINISLTINGDYATSAPTIIDGGGVNTVVTIPNAGTIVTLSKLTIQNGASSYVGGGINNYGTLTITNSTISGNSAVYHGGGIANWGTATITRSTFSGNGATESGGGVWNNWILSITNSTITANSADGGGGIANQTVLTLGNTTVSGNSGSAGSGIWNSDILTISNSTISGDTSNYYGGAIYNVWTATLQNTIVGNSPSGGNCYGEVASNGYNLSSDGTCNLSGPGDLQNTDPKLGTLKNNGGPTWTQALLPGSPAINAGNPGPNDGKGNHCLPTDQRGVLRVASSDRCDMGAYEYP